MDPLKKLKELEDLMKKLDDGPATAEEKRKANEWLAPEGLNKENSFTCASCNDQMHLIYSMPMKFIKAEGHVMLPFKMKGTNPPPPANATERMCIECYNKLYHVLGQLGEHACVKALDNLSRLIEMKQANRAQRN